jgi:hypothetical protein
VVARPRGPARYVLVRLLTHNTRMMRLRDGEREV